MKSEKDKTIMCPKCGKFLTKARSNENYIHKLACKNCNKWIWYNPTDDNYSKVKEIPSRTTSSGMRFY